MKVGFQHPHIIDFRAFFYDHFAQDMLSDSVDDFYFSFTFCKSFLNFCKK